ncbi:MAG: hypothetical protein ACJ8J7_13135, partial [Sulfurifustaceae bacterium]
MRKRAEENRGEVILYKTEGGKTVLDVRLHHDTVWLSLNQMAVLFDRDKSVISRHLKDIFATRELTRKSVVAKNATTAADGKSMEYDNLIKLDHVSGLSSAVNAVLTAAIAGGGGTCQSYSTGGRSFENCNYTVKAPFASGDSVGTVGGTPGVYAWDFGVQDARRTPIVYA